ncbi:MAG: hypothetical protein DRI90_11895 [Deltaproteobacteria bacterium]|nr:MAG: hypothetical protein DRI90_11895 [Deltaproteobacteria bacterium]
MKNLGPARLAQRIQAHRLPLGLAFGGAIIAVGGIAMWIHATVSTTLDVAIADLERGANTPSDFIRVEAQALGRSRYCAKSRGGGTCYTPLVSAPAVTDVSLIVEHEAMHDGAGTFTGYLSGSPQIHVRKGLAARGISLTSHASVLHAGETPEERRPLGIIIGIAGTLLCFGGSFWLRRSWAR